MIKGIYIRVDEELLEKFDKMAKRLGYMRSEALREAMRRFISYMEEGETAKIRGLVKSKLSLEELEEAYMVAK